MVRQRPDSLLATFLSLVVATRPQHRGLVDSVWVGEPHGSGDYERSFMLADYRVLSGTVRGDSATAIAAIITVADLRIDESVPKDSFAIIGRIAVREDTVIWALARESADTARWRVVGDGRWARWGRDGTAVSVELFGERVDRWEPRGASLAAALALVDSIRRARGHPIIR